MTSVETVIVGAGFAGIAAALALRAAGRDDFVLIERAGAIGGTWRDNVYPGVACDVPAHLYGLRGHPSAAWSRVFAPGAEIRAYLESIFEAEGLGDRLLLNTPLIGARRDGDGWAIETGARVMRARNLILACGRLTAPALPTVPGLDGAGVPVFHSSRWEPMTVAGRRIAVVGTGASGVQLVPALVAGGAEVVLFQRTPAWIVPKNDRAYAADERAAFSRPETAAALRAEQFAEGEARFASRSGDERAAAEAEATARAHLRTQIADPVLRDALTPRYAFGCKRVLLSDDFYPAVATDAVSLVPHALASADGRVLTATDGSTHEVDAVVLATGFRATRQPYAPLVVGEDGATLDEHWSTGMSAVASTIVSGFPNLFVLGGPNATLGHNSSVLLLEEQADFAARLIAAGLDARVDDAAEAADRADVDARAATTPWITGGCDNWYVDPRSGRLTLLWPGTVAAFRERLARAGAALGLAPSIPSALSEGAPS